MVLRNGDAWYQRRKNRLVMASYMRALVRGCRKNDWHPRVRLTKRGVQVRFIPLRSLILTAIDEGLGKETGERTRTNSNSEILCLKGSVSIVQIIAHMYYCLHSSTTIVSSFAKTSTKIWILASKCVFQIQCMKRGRFYWNSRKHSKGKGGVKTCQIMLISTPLATNLLLLHHIFQPKGTAIRRRKWCMSRMEVHSTSLRGKKMWWLKFERYWKYSCCLTDTRTANRIGIGPIQNARAFERRFP